MCLDSFAGQWINEDECWRYKKDDDTYAVNEYINDNKKWYYFGYNGFLAVDTVTPDGLYYVDKGGVRGDSTGIDEDEMDIKSQNTKIIIFNKTTHYLQMWINGNKAYQCIGTSGRNKEDKNVEGDGSTPEGEFYICRKNPNSSCYRAFVLSYPNIEDAERGLQQGNINESQYNSIVKAIKSGGVPPLITGLGGYIEIHAFRNDTDITNGCITVLHKDMDAMWNFFDVGTKVIIMK